MPTLDERYEKWFDANASRGMDAVSHKQAFLAGAAAERRVIEPMLDDLIQAADHRGFSEALLRQEPSQEHANRFERNCKKLNDLRDEITRRTDQQGK